MSTVYLINGGQAGVMQSTERDALLDKQPVVYLHHQPATNPKPVKSYNLQHPLTKRESRNRQQKLTTFDYEGFGFVPKSKIYGQPPQKKAPSQVPSMVPSMAPSMASSMAAIGGGPFNFFPFVGVLFILFGAGMSVVGFMKSVQHDEAQRRYQRRRAEIQNRARVS